jgi:hypothetical protein
MKRTYVYIDGFNFYYGCYKDISRPNWAKYKWLDLERFCDALFPKDNIVTIKYYTALVNNRPPDNHQHDRQKIYLAALTQLKRVEVIHGHFLTEKRKMPLCSSSGTYLGRSAWVLKTEEKGSDVNLAVDLLYDCIKGLYDYAMVISNDSDLVAPIKIVRTDFGKKIGLVNPHTKRPSIQLVHNVDLRFRITEAMMASSQLPGVVKTSAGIALQCPTSWR